jgi:hypothetical protein
VFGAQKNKEEFLMTNTSLRKKALLSSVAMMLVALVALGSATFAWFAVDPHVSTTDSLKMTTKASTGIKLLSKSEYDLWAAAAADEGNTGFTAVADAYAKNGVYLDAVLAAGATSTNLALATRSTQIQTNATGHVLTVPIIPITSGLSDTAADDTVFTSNNTWKTASGTDADTSTVLGSYSDASLGDSNRYIEKIYLMKTTTDGNEAVAKAKVTWEADAETAIASALRVALLSSDGKLLGIWGDTASTVYGYNGTAGAALSGDFVKANGTEATLRRTQAVSGTVADDSSCVQVVVYIDGEATSANSTNAFNANANSKVILKNLEVELTVG